MTIEDIVLFLFDESQEQTLTESIIRRCILLAYAMGMEAGKAEYRPSREAAGERR